MRKLAIKQQEVILDLNPVSIIIVVFIVQGVILAVVCGVIAFVKNRSVVGYVFLGLFLGIIGLVITALMPKREIGTGIRETGTSS